MARLDYVEPELSVGVESALDALMRAARRDGYEMTAHVSLTLAQGGARHFVVSIHDRWYELKEVDDLGRAV